MTLCVPIGYQDKPITVRNNKTRTIYSTRGHIRSNKRTHLFLVRVLISRPVQLVLHTGLKSASCRFYFCSMFDR